MEQLNKLNIWFNSVNKRFGTDVTVSDIGSMPLLSTWKVNLRRKYLQYSKFTVQKFQSGCATGSKKELMGSWKATGQDGLIQCPNKNISNSQISLTADPLHMDLTPAYGHALWLQGLSKKNFHFHITLPMFPKFSISSDFQCKDHKRYWLVQMKLFNLAGYVTNIQTLKKSKKRKCNNPVRGRSQFQTRSYFLSNMGTPAFSASDTNNGTAEHSQNIWNNRTASWKILVPVSGRIQRRHVYSVSATGFTQLFSENISHTRQCSISQGQRCMEMVFSEPQASRSFQPSRIFSRTQCCRENMASYSVTWYSQQIFSESTGTAFNTDLDVSQYSEKSRSNYGLSATISMNNILCRFTYANLYSHLKWYRRRKQEIIKNFEGLKKLIDKLEKSRIEEYRKK